MKAQLPSVSARWALQNPRTSYSLFLQLVSTGLPPPPHRHPQRACRAPLGAASSSWLSTPLATSLQRAASIWAQRGVSGCEPGLFPESACISAAPKAGLCWARERRRGPRPPGLGENWCQVPARPGRKALLRAAHWCLWCCCKWGSRPSTLTLQPWVLTSPLTSESWGGGGEGGERELRCLGEGGRGTGSGSTIKATGILAPQCRQTYSPDSSLWSSQAGDREVEKALDLPNQLEHAEAAHTEQNTQSPHNCTTQAPAGFLLSFTCLFRWPSHSHQKRRLSPKRA